MNTDTDMTTVTDLSTAEATPMASASAAPSAASPSKDTPADPAASAVAIAGIQASINSFGPAVASAVFSAVPNGVTADFPPKTGLVRRLTPVETCRLMGFPDDYLDVDGPETKDAPRYKACGNSWAVNCAEFVNTRVERALREEGVVKDGDPVRYATTCSGVEAHSLSVRDGHWQAKFFSEIEPFPCRVLAHRYPDVPNLGDMTVLDGTKYALDVFSGGTPCFVAGTLVLTPSGYRRIEDLRVGDEVIGGVTGQMRRVEAVGSKRARVGLLKVTGRPAIVCTPNHPFYCAEPVRGVNRKAPFTVGDFSFTRADKCVGKYAGFAHLAGSLDATKAKVPRIGRLTHEDMMALAGWFLGNGYICPGETAPHDVRIILTDSDRREAFAKAFDGKVKYDIVDDGKVENGGAYAMVHSGALAKWLMGNFFDHTIGKKIPYWAYSDVDRAALAAHCVFAFGEIGVCTTFSALAYGLADLMGICSVDTRRIGGADFYRLGGIGKSFGVGDNRVATKVRAFDCDGKASARVYNITVSDEHAYVVEGLCCHNCQSLSVAGKRHGMAEGSGTRSSLAFHWLRIAVEAGAKIALWENVCFGAGTLVTTAHGHRKIEDVKVGDRVRSIDGKMHLVEKVMATKGKNTVTLRVMGADPITVTPNHPFYVRMKDNKGNFSAPEWLPAGVLAKDCYVAYKIDAPGKETIGLANAYAVGRWLADGSVTMRAENGRNGSRNGQMARIFISTGLKKRDSLAKELERLPYAIRESKVKDYAVNFSFTSDAFYNLIKDCGKGARNKVVPEYVYSLIPEEQAELLRGYLDGDGSRHRRTEMTYSSSSRDLAMGIARLVRDVYQRGVCMRFVKKPETVEIGGRTVKAHDQWVCSFSLCPASQSKNGSFEEDGFVWCPVRSVTKGEKQTVYNLTVADLHTYEANDVVVHNCGAFTVNGGRDFAWFVFRLIEAGWGVAWRVLDAQFTSSWRFPRAIPQRRRRIWLVAVRDGDWQLASRILFERTAKTGLRPPVRVLGDGTVVDDDEDAQTRLRFFTRASRADWLPKDFFGGPGVSLTDTRARRAIGQLGEIHYLGGMFAQPDLFGFGGEETPECIDSAFLDALGAGSGIAVGRNVCVLQSALWPAGIQPTCAALAAANGDAAAVEPSPAYDGTLCGLSDVLLPWNDDLIRFVLSIRACAGIIRRAAARGKELRPILTEALGGQIACWANGLLDPYLAKSGKSDAEDEEESEDDLDLDENGLPCDAEGDGEGGEYEEAQ